MRAILRSTVYWGDTIMFDNFQRYVRLIYSDELEIKDSTESDKSASYLDIIHVLNIDSNGRLTTTLYDCLWCVYLPIDSIRKSTFLRMRAFQNEANY
jgi:hypothetical protein